VKTKLLFIGLTIVAIIAIGCAAPAAPAAPPPPATAAPPQPAAPVATSAPAAPAITRGGSLRIGLANDLTTMDPHLSTAYVDRIVYQSIFNPLVRLDKDLTLKPELAEKWEYTDPTTLVFTLRKGVKFHDGTEFNAQAVKINFDRMMNPDTKSLRASEIASVKEVQVVDDSTIKLILKAPNSSLLAQLSDRAGMIISPAAIQKYGKDLARNPVGTGPFQFVEWVTGDHLTVKKFDGYWEKGADGQPLPYLDSVVFKGIPDGTVRLTALKTGAIDMVDAPDAKDVPGLKAGKDPIYDQVPGLGYQGIEINTANAPFNKLEARQAVAYAVDAAAITKNILFDTATPGEGPIPPASWAYDASVNIYKRDPAKAKDLLTKAGFTLPVKFPAMVTNDPQNLLIGQALKEQLAEGGFDMDIQQLDFPTALAKETAKDYTFWQVGWSGRADPDGNTYNFIYSTGGNNTNNWKNAKADELLDQTRIVSDQAKRKDLYTQIITIVNNEVQRVYLWWPADRKTYSTKVMNFVHSADGMVRTKEMWLAKGTQ
jgi:peptide/nickel transport system substrate-binding protein